MQISNHLLNINHSLCLLCYSGFIWYWYQYTVISVIARSDPGLTSFVDPGSTFQSQLSDVISMSYRITYLAKSRSPLQGAQVLWLQNKPKMITHLLVFLTFGMMCLCLYHVFSFHLTWCFALWLNISIFCLDCLKDIVQEVLLFVKQLCKPKLCCHVIFYTDQTSTSHRFQPVFF